MGGPRVDPAQFIGQRFGRWVIIGVGNPERSVKHVLCRCSCGTIREIRLISLRNGSPASCGCARRKRGGLYLSEGRWHIYCRDGTGLDYARGVMAAQLGRMLRSDEIVHHVNENPTDDRPENLEIHTSASHGELHAANRSPGFREKVAIGTRQSWKDPKRRAGLVLDWEKVREIRRLLADGETPLAISDQFGVCRRTIYGIKNGQHWRED